MQRREIEALCAVIVPGTGALEINELSRGLVNESYRVTRTDRDYVLRVPLADGALIALDRAWEARLLQVAGEAGVASALRFHDDARGILLSDWLVGASWAGIDAESSPSIERIAQLLRRVHALSIPQPAHRMNPATWIRHYESIAQPDAQMRGRDAIRRASQLCLEEWAALPAVPEVVCHGDLHALNLVQSDNSVRLLDWEYAHVSDTFWDLAGWCANNDLTEDARRRLLSCYLKGTPAADQWRRLALSAWLYDYVCLQWSALYLNRHSSATAAAGIAARAALLDARLSIPAN
jgi:aminoglycoside phosphotransferase (APT) family kinase protein